MSQPMLTPFSPSRKAKAKVRDPFPVPVTCHYCAGDVRCKHHRDIYEGREYGVWPWMYVCEDCGARVGMHPFTDIPLGTLADAPTRNARTACKPYFLSVEKIMRDRSRAYAWLAKQLGITAKQCHFGLFTVEQCHKARDVCSQFIIDQGYSLPLGAPVRRSD